MPLGSVLGVLGAPLGAPWKPLQVSKSAWEAFWGRFGGYGGHFWRLDANMETLKKGDILLYFLALGLIRDPSDAPGGDSESPNFILGDTMAAFWDLKCTLGSLQGPLGIPKRAMFGR